MKIMGRKRLDKTKKNITLRVDPDIYEQLTKDGVNKSRLFSIAGKKYLRKKQRSSNKNKKWQNSSILLLK